VENQTIARPYAKAVFRFASESNKLDDWSVMLNSLALAAEDSHVKQFINSPTISRDERAQVVCDVLADTLNSYGKNLVRAMSDCGRLNLLPEVYRQFVLLKAEQEKSQEVTVYSVYPLSEIEKESLVKRLSEYFSAEVKLNVEIDKELIGGIVIKSSGVVIDHSVKGRLLKLAEALEI